MAFVVGYGVAILGAIFAYLLSENKSKKSKYIIWGIALMVAISPFLSFAVGLTYASLVENGWAILGIFSILFPIGFVSGLIMLLKGIFKKEKAEEHL
ncbi:hypothetical protein MUN88_12275 [Gracilibacillus caseinilyticus]|uniref:Major facilitator superfamily (MFS) profile domain-containing protein n=1 Tax=Gracilibacillus caseinilyticus TaxID=2932256 RepID=A0ABY4ER17_9BACI|nr:hypothetical protein [Gracilibacillus caseinilyticus]UOQ46869.1 hypothetical protein MUN88_12275 [Gracilibacillus caseinilyticus]